MNREDLLLTPEERKYQIDYVYKNNPHLTIEIMLDALLESTCKAQLGKVLHGNWVDKPDSEGWWWYRRNGRFGEFMDCYYISDDLALDNVHSRNGRWSKAIVPEKE